ncbi:MAG TPA: hypothetical protein VGN52_06335, partial [Burkholderiales bacterium]
MTAPRAKTKAAAKTAVKKRAAARQSQPDLFASNQEENELENTQVIDEDVPPGDEETPAEMSDGLVA